MNNASKRDEKYSNQKDTRPQFSQGLLSTKQWYKVRLDYCFQDFSLGTGYYILSAQDILSSSKIWQIWAADPCHLYLHFCADGIGNFIQDVQKIIDSTIKLLWLKGFALQCITELSVHPHLLFDDLIASF